MNLDGVVAIILQRRVSHRPLKVAIDGRCAAGKSTLAKQLAARIDCASVIFSIDNFHHPREHRYRQGENSARGYYEDAFDSAAVVESVLKPLSGNSFPALSGRRVSICRQTFRRRLHL